MSKELPVKKFMVAFSRDVAQTVTIEVEAASEEEAQSTAWGVVNDPHAAATLNWEGCSYLGRTTQDHVEELVPADNSAEVHDPDLKIFQVRVIRDAPQFVDVLVRAKSKREARVKVLKAVGSDQQAYPFEDSGDDGSMECDINDSDIEEFTDPVGGRKVI
jgi:hypothetical protein